MRLKRLPGAIYRVMILQDLVRIADLNNRLEGDHAMREDKD